jgi:hypothetical protein
VRVHARRTADSNNTHHMLGLVQAIIKADIVPRLLQLLAADELMRWKVAKVVKYITRGNAPQIECAFPPRVTCLQDFVLVPCPSLTLWSVYAGTL